jgi:DUF1680 family protein
MPVERVYAHPDVLADEEHVALQRGPIVYCLEAVDNDFALNRLRLDSDAHLTAEFDANLLGGVVVVKGSGMVADTSEWGSALYRTAPPTWKPVEFKAVPYYSWDNRAPGTMRVWLQA